jgi:hypothetical protein
MLLREVTDVGRDALGFVLVVAADQHAHRRTIALLAPQVLRILVRVVLDQRIRRAQDSGSGSDSSVRA